MTACRFISMVHGMSLVVNGGPSYFNALRCFGRGFGPAERTADVGRETCRLVHFWWRR